MKNKQQFIIKNGSLFDGMSDIEIKNIKVLELYSNEGANAFVFKAYDTMLEREVALKIWCRVDRKANERLLKAKKECSKIARLKHPNITTIHYADIIKGYPIAIVDFLHGITLFDWLKTSPSFQKRSSIWLNISDALETSHKSGVIHGDLHSQNINGSRKKS